MSCNGHACDGMQRNKGNVLLPDQIHMCATAQPQGAVTLHLWSSSSRTTAVTQNLQHATTIASHLSHTDSSTVAP